MEPHVIRRNNYIFYIQVDSTVHVLRSICINNSGNWLFLYVYDVIWWIFPTWLTACSIIQLVSFTKENFIYRCMKCTVLLYKDITRYLKELTKFLYFKEKCQWKDAAYETNMKENLFLQVNMEQVALRKINNLYSKHALINALVLIGCYLPYSGITWYMHRINWKEKYVQPIFFNVQ